MFDGKWFARKGTYGLPVPRHEPFFDDVFKDFTASVTLRRMPLNLCSVLVVVLDLRSARFAWRIWKGFAIHGFVADDVVHISVAVVIIIINITIYM